MSNGNGNEVSAATDTSSLGHHTGHSACKIEPYEDLTDVTIDCELWQDLGKGKGLQRVSRFYDPTKAGTFKAKVCLDGGLRFHLCGTLCLCVHVECVGPRDPSELQCVKVQLDPCKDLEEDKSCYDLEISIPPGHFDPGECGNYCCFVATVTSFLPYPCHEHPGHICCYCRGPCVMVCRPPSHP